MLSDQFVIDKFVINEILRNFDFMFMLIINILTYLVIKVLDFANGQKKVSLIMKRVVFLTSAFFLFCLYLALGYNDKIILINSLILAPISWSWLFKPIFERMGAGYAKDL